MPGGVAARARVYDRYFKHRFTLIPRGQTPDNVGTPGADEGEDEWGQPIPTQDTDPGAPAAIPNIPAAYFDAGTYMFGAQGPIQNEFPTLLVAHDQPMHVGDEVRQVVDETGQIVLNQATIESFTANNSGGPVLWWTVYLRVGEVEGTSTAEFVTVP